MLANGDTSGAVVLAPFDGSIPGAFPPGEKIGCIEITATNGRFGAVLCHVLLDRPFGRGERNARGQLLGTVGAAGTVGNNGLPHVHFELHAGGRNGGMVPFSVTDGFLPLDGWDLQRPATRTITACRDPSSRPTVRAELMPPAAADCLPG